MDWQQGWKWTAHSSSRGRVGSCRGRSQLPPWAFSRCLADLGLPWSQRALHRSGTTLAQAVPLHGIPQPRRRRPLTRPYPWQVSSRDVLCTWIPKDVVAIETVTRNCISYWNLLRARWHLSRRLAPECLIPNGFLLPADLGVNKLLLFAASLSPSPHPGSTATSLHASNYCGTWAHYWLSWTLLTLMEISALKKKKN